MPNYPYRNIGAFFDRVFRNDLNANFSDIEKDFKDQKVRVDNLLTAETTAGELEDLRQDNEGVIHPIAKDRFTADAERVSQNFSDVNTQLAENTQQLSKIGFVRRGKVKIPSVITKKLPFELYRDNGLMVKHNFDIDSQIQGVSIYVDSINGNDTNDGLTNTTPVKTMEQAFSIANNRVESDIVIRVLSRIIHRNDLYNITGTAYALQKNFSIVAENDYNEVYLSSAERHADLTWTADGTAYKTTRSATNEVVDVNYKDYKGIPKRLKKVGSVTEVQNEKGTWYTDGTTVWVRRLDDSAPTIELMLLLKIAGFNWDASGKKLILQNVKFLFADSVADAFKITGDENTTFIHDKCAYAYAAGGNGLATINIGEVYGFNSVASYNRRDGFNYHGHNVANPYEFVFEYFVNGAANGWGGEGNNNATTGHDGMTIMRVGSVGYDCDGPVLADVSGCTVVCIDCDMHDSIRSSSITKAAYYFSSSGGNNLGDIYLINCGGGGVDTFSIAGDGTQNIYLQNFKGNNIHDNITFEVIS